MAEGAPATAGDVGAGAPVGEPVAEPGPEEPGGTILTDVAALAAERDEYLTALQRLKADFDNYRKRVLRQQEEQTARAEGSLVAKLLPVLDNLDLAWAHLGGAGNGSDEEARAVGQALAQILDVLGKEGLERVDAADVPFDPVVHDAVAHVPADEPARGAGSGAGTEEGTVDTHGATPADASGTEEGTVGTAGTAAATQSGADGGSGPTVSEIMRAGYRWRGQVLRPAMVRVRG